MILRNSLYKIVRSDLREGEGDFTLKLNAAHPIYKAHFPSLPVTPGVCLCALARELMEVVAGRCLQLRDVKNAKFLKVLGPLDYSVIQASVKRLQTEEGETKAQVSIFTPEGETFAKLSMTAV